MTYSQAPGRARPYILAYVFLIIIFSSLPSSFAEEVSQRFCINPQVRGNDKSQKRGANFITWRNLDFRQQLLLQTLSNNRQPADISYTSLTLNQDGEAATFLAVTNALRLTQIFLKNNRVISALDMIKGVREIRTDRLILMMDLGLLQDWRDAGGRYVMTLPKNATEKGQVKFATHSLPSGGLHCGYDLNWYTKANKTPHLHWNVRFSDGQADVHLDGYPAYVFGFIPNPFHLTYQNSDVRFWLSNYLKKYGAAGFTVKK